MKKSLLALMILGVGASAIAGFNLLANQSRAAANHSRAECRRLTSQVKELGVSVTDLRAQVETKQKRLNQASATSSRAHRAARVVPGASSRDTRGLTAAQLRQQLGIAWDNSPDYILVNKALLIKDMYVPEFERDGVLTPAACAALVLTPDERATIETALKRAEAEHAAWAKTALQRVEPAGDVLADYRLPANPELARQLYAEQKALLSTALGPDRAGMVRSWSDRWWLRHWSLGERNSRFTVRRHTDGRSQPLWHELTLGPILGITDGALTPDAVFPDLLRSVFPGGWRDLAQREGFALPMGFE
jgi:hypothetical protein